MIAINTSTSLFAEGLEKVLEDARRKVSERQYLTAFQSLQDFDPKDENPDIVLYKEEIALDYYVQNMEYQAFAFKNLTPGDQLSDVRKKEGSFKMIYFPIDKVISTLLEKYPENCKLYKGLGNFHYEIFLKYGNHGIGKLNNLSSLIESNYGKAIEKKCENDTTHFNLGYVNLRLEKYKESIPFFLKSIALNEQNSYSHYNLASAYIGIGEDPKALPYAEKAFELFTDNRSKGSAARMMAGLYYRLKDEAKSIEYYELANRTDPKNYNNMKPLLAAYVFGSNEKRKELQKDFFNLGPEKPTIHDDLAEIYFQSRKIEELIEFYKQQIPIFQNNPKILGSIHFYIGRLFIESDKKSAKEHLLLARKIFSRVFQENHPIFNAIESGLKTTEN